MLSFLGIFDCQVQTYVWKVSEQITQARDTCSPSKVPTLGWTVIFQMRYSHLASPMRFKPRASQLAAQARCMQEEDMRCIRSMTRLGACLFQTAD